ncbi:MAG: hypothetical protein Fues2KO_29910 [Fuerstiella sp.]
MSLKQLINRIRWQAGYYRHLLRSARSSQESADVPSCAVLEERILMSATPLAAAAPEVAAAAGASADGASNADFPLENHLAASDFATHASSTGENVTGAEQAVTQAASLEVVVVDESIDDVEQLLADLQQQSEGPRRFEVFTLDSHRDGVEQISEIVSRFDQIDALHIVTHGTDGAVRLGNLLLTADNLSGYAGEFASWGRAMSTEADVLFYGCELAESDSGRELMQSIAVITGADVAASDDDTGHADLGGDWNLEFIVGQVDVDVAFSAQLQQSWVGLLATSETHYFLAGGGIPEAMLETAIPTGTAIPDYDSGRHAGAGTLVDKGGSGFAESDAVKHQRWQTASGGITINGPVQLNLWSHIKDFNTTKGATVHAYLIDIRNNGSDAQLVATDSVTRSAWNPSGDWVYDTFDFGTINRSLAANRRLQVKVVVDGSSDDGIVFGYDSIFHRSHLVVGMTTANGDPVLNNGGGPFNYSENDGPKEIGGGLSLTDDDANLQWATVQLTGNFNAAEDSLAFTDPLPPGVTMQVDAATGQIVFYGAASVADYEAVLKKVSYTNSSEDPSELTRTVTFEVYDGQNLSTVTQTIDVTAVNDAPTVAPNAAGTGLEDQNLVYTHAQILTLIGASDVDHSNSELTVNITGVNNASFSKAGSGSGTTYTFTLTQPAHSNGYNVTFNYEVVDPELANASAGPATIAIQAVNDEPGLTLGADQNVNEDTGAHTVNSFASATPGGGADESGQTFTYLVSNNNGSLFAVAPAIDAAGNLTYTLAADAFGSATVTVQVRDSGGTANGGDDTSGSQQFTINVANSNNDDAYVAANAGLAIDENATKTITSAMLRVADPDLPAASSLVYTVVSPPTLGRLELTTNPGVAATSFTQEDIDLNRLRYVHAGAEAPLTDSFDFTATDGIGTPTANQTFNVTISSVNDAPVNSVPGAQSTMLNTPLTFDAANSNLISISDADAGGSQVQVTLTATNGTASIVLPFTSATAVGGETVVPSNTGQSQHSPAVARNASGDYVVVWSGKGPGDADGVYFQRLDASHVAQGVQTRVNTTTTDAQIEPQVAMDAAGNFIVVWTSNLQDGNGTGVYARKFDSTGTALSGEVLVNTYIIGGQDAPDIAMDADGDFVVVWQSNGQDGHSDGVYGQLFDSAMTKVGTEFQVSTITAFKQYRPAVAMDADGDFVVAWEDSKADAGQPGIFVRRYDRTGAARDLVPVLANSSSLKKQEFPDVAMDNAGNFVVVWTSQEQDTPTSRGIYGQLFSADGTKTGPGEFLVNTFVTGEQTDASVAMDADGDFVVTWESQNQDNPGDLLTGVYAQQFDSDATKVGSELQVNTTVTGTQKTPQVAVDADGDFVVVWGGEGAGDTDGVFTQRYDLPAPPLTFIVGDGTADTTMTFRGTVADINSALDGMTFSPNTAFVGTATLQVVTNDLGNTGPGGAQTDDDTININVLTVNTNPTISSDGGGATAAVNITSGNTAVTTVTATDSDVPAQTLTYSISGGADASKFTINNTSGALNFLLPPLFVLPTDANLDNVYEVEVQVSDGAGGTDTQAISVTVLAGNANPVITSDGGGASAGINVAENSTAVTTVTATDSDVPAQTLTYSISGGADAAWFAINSTSGELTFGSAPDFESPTDSNTDNIYHVAVQVSDGAGGTDAQNISVTVTDANDNAPVVTAAQGFNVDEDAADGTSLGNVVATDADAVGSLTNWAIVGGNTDGIFAINGSTGELTVADNTNLDFETTNSYVLSVRVEDGVNVSATETVAVTINDRFEGVFVVDTTADVLDGDVSSGAALLANKGADGKISLREAIAAANNTANGGSPDEIRFNFADNDAGHVYYRNDGIADSLTNVVTTSLSDAAITDFDADYPYAQHSWFRIDVNSALPQLTITDAVVIDGYSQAGATQNVLAAGQNAKLRVELTSSGGDNKYGLLLDTGADGSTIRGLAVNGFDWTGVMIDYSVAGNTIAGSFIGTDITGTQAIANGDAGIQIRGSTNTIGGSNVADRNVISGGNNRGIALFNSGTITGNVIRNNFIGVDATGIRDLGNNSSGIQLYNSDGALVRDNVVSGNQDHGIWFRSGATLNTNNIIRGNIVGLGADGATVIGNGQNGLMLEVGSGNLIGGTTSGEGNFVAHNGGDGIRVINNGSDGNAIRGNVIFSNTGLGIDLDNNGVTVNDVNDSDSGANQEQNYPVLAAATISGADVTVTGTISSTASTTLHIDFFASATADASGHGEAERYLGSTTVVTDGGGTATINSLLSGASVSAGERVTATATDAAGNTSEFAANITGVAANANPSITSNGGGANAAINVAENSTAVTTVTATDADLPAQTLTYTISGGADAARFAINSSSGALTFVSAPDFEAPSDVGTDNVYDVQVTVSDGAGGTDVQDIAVAVTDVGLLAYESFSYGAGNLQGANGGTGWATGWNVSSGSTAVVDVNGLDDPTGLLPTAGGAAEMNTSSNFVQTRELSTALGADGTSAWFSILLRPDSIAFDGMSLYLGDVGGPNDHVTIGAFRDDFLITRNSSTATGTYINNVVTSGQTYLLTARVDFAAGADTVTLYVDPTPGLGSPDSPGAMTAQLTTADLGSFTTVGMVGGFTGNRAQFDELRVGETFLDVAPAAANTPPTITSNGGGASAAVNVAENGTAVTTMTASDPEAPPQILTWSITGGADAARFAINSTTGALSFVAAPDFEAPTDANTDNVYHVTVQVSDGFGGTDAQNVSVTVTAANDNSPVITSNGGGATAAMNVAENSTAVTTVTATDADLPAQTLSYSISGGADAARFAINGTTGALTFVAAPNFEAPTDAGTNNVYDVQVTVSDGAGGTDVQDIAVTVTDQNEFAVSAVSDANAAVNQISEVTTNGSTVGITAAAQDNDGSTNAITFSLDDNAGGRFAINGSSGIVTVNNAALLDYESATSHSITIRATSADGSFSTQNYSVAVLPVDDEAPVFTSPASVNHPENNLNVLTLTATDADDPATVITFTIVGGDDAGRFHITGADGLKLTSPADFESPTDADTDNVYEVSIQASDGVGNVTVQNLLVTILNVNEKPKITSNGAGATASVNVVEGTSAVTVVTASDPDLPPQTLSYAITGGADAARFTVNGATGSLNFVAPPSHATPTDADTDNVYHVTVQVSDGAGGTDTQAIAVTVVPSNVAPVGSVTISGTAAQNETLTAGHTLTDADGMGAISWQWRRNGVDIAGATASTYALTEADVGTLITVTASYTDGGGTNESVASTAVGPVANVNDLPTGSVTISGIATEDQMLTASETLADADGMGVISWQWLRDGSAIAGATANTYTLTDADVGTMISVAASWVDGHGTNEQVISSAVGSVANLNDVPTGVVSISGLAIEDQTLTASNTLADADGLGVIGYQWLRNGSVITGATGTTYTLGDADVGQLISVQASWVDGHGTAEAVVSSVIGPVANVNDAPVVAPLSGRTIDEDTSIGAVIAIATATDPDAGDTLAWSITDGNDDGHFAIAADGSLVLIGPLNYLETSEYRLTVTATDSGTPALDGSTIVVVTVNRVVVPAPETETRPPEEKRKETSDDEAVETPVAPTATGTPAGEASTTSAPGASNAGAAPDQQPEVVVAPPAVVAVEDSGPIFVMPEISTHLADVVEARYGNGSTEFRRDESDNQVPTTSVPGYELTFRSAELNQSLAQMKTELKATATTQYFTAATAVTTTSSLTVGYVLWAIRGGWLASSILAQMPAWRLIDPLVVLSSLDGASSAADDQSLQDMLEDGVREVESEEDA